MSNIKYLKLRFPEFTGEWEVRKLGELIKVNMCKRIFSNQTASIGEVPFYKIGTLGDKADSYISRELFEEYKDKYNYPRKGEILITCSGTVGKTVIYDGRDSYYQDSNIVWLNNDNKIICNSIIKIIISRIDWNRKLNSTTITRLYNDDIRSLIIEFPTEKEEQQKIGDFFMLLDKRIEQQEQKIALLKDYKKGMMQKIFSQKIRFKDENGNNYPDWEEKKLGEVCNITTGKLDANAMSPGGKYRFYTCAKEFYNIDYFAFDTEALLISGNGANVGYIHYYNGKFNAYQRTYVLDNFSQNTLFIKYFLDEFLYKRINSEKKDGNTPYIVIGVLLEMKLLFPILSEQEKISILLFKIDNNIEKQEIILEKLKSKKKSLLYNMFM